MKIYYENSRNEILDLISPPYVVRDISELLDYSWDYINNEFKIYGYNRGICEIPISVNIVANEKEYPDVSNRFFEVIEYDILQNKRGKIWYDGQYVLCNLVSSKKTDWCMGVNFHISNVRIVTDFPFWISEKKLSFGKYNGSGSNNFLNYPYNYPYNYTGINKGFSQINNEHYSSVHFRMTIYGPCVNPMIIIGGHTYIVNTIVGENEYLEIDSRNRTVIKTLIDGTKVNEFNNRGQRIFERIPPGELTVNWSGEFGFDIILYYERSEPKWIQG